jgi:hypothetical protein
MPDSLAPLIHGIRPENTQFTCNFSEQNAPPARPNLQRVRTNLKSANKGHQQGRGYGGRWRAYDGHPRGRRWEGPMMTHNRQYDGHPRA